MYMTILRKMFTSFDRRRDRFSWMFSTWKSFSNVHKGKIQGQSQIDVDVFTDNGRSTKDGEKGELVVKQPFPSMPVKFWGDDDGKYHKAYFSRYKNIWHHGDLLRERK